MKRKTKKPSYTLVVACWDAAERDFNDAHIECGRRLRAKLKEMRAQILCALS